MVWFKKQILETRDRDAVLRALVEIAEGLNCLHCNGVIHGDLKPENIMFDTDSRSGRPKVIDFNFSGIDQKTNALLKVKTAALGASVGYTPPEFFDGSTHSRTRGSDVYSLGQTYRVLLGMARHSSFSSSLTGQAGSVQAVEKLKIEARALLGDDIFNELTKLSELMTRVAPEKRISLCRTRGTGPLPAAKGANPSSTTSSSSPSSVLEVLNLLKAGKVKELSRCLLM